jgi:hypothetical protein
MDGNRGQSSTQARRSGLQKCRPKTKKKSRKYAAGKALAEAQGIVAYKLQDWVKIR